MVDDTMIGVGDNYYCANKGSCCDKIMCVKCDKKVVKALKCMAHGCEVSSEYKCTTCGPLKHSLVYPENSGAGLCEQHFVEENVKNKCERCKETKRYEFTCLCCKEKFCDKCSQRYIVNVAPYVNSYSCHKTHDESKSYCRACTSDVTVMDIEKLYRTTGRYRCKTHSQLPYVLDRHAYVCCSRHVLRSGEFKDTILLFRKDKTRADELSSENFKEVRAYCDTHKQKEVNYDGFEFVFPDIN